MARILTAEDDPDIRFLVRIRLEALGHHVTDVDNGIKAFEACRAETFDLAVLDVSMPGMTGLEVTRRVRFELGSTMPVLLVSAWSMPEDVERGAAAGADDFLAKPFKLLDLAARVDRLLLGAASGTDDNSDGRRTPSS